MQTANGRKDRGPVCAGRLHGDDGGPNGPGGSGWLPCCDAPCRSAPAARARRIRRGSPPAKFEAAAVEDRKSTRLNSSHTVISYAVFCLKKKKKRHMIDDDNHYV